ncbi:MAG TPA: radical SAM protein [Methylomicrobium sp.]|nr:radical SAM protein [Methylomicrobium sp.]
MSITERIDAITGIPENYRANFLPMPRAVKIELTARCNFRCKFCARGSRLRIQQDMDRAFFSRIIREMRDSGVEELGLFYLGESFLCSWLEEAIAEAKEIGFPYVFLTTNGSLAFPARVEKCIRSGLDSLKFSWNYIDAGQFRDITRVKDAYWRQMWDNIQAAVAMRNMVLAETGHRCGIYASYIEYDGEQAKKMAPIVGWLSTFLDEVYALPLYSQASLCRKQEKEEGWTPVAGVRGRSGNLRDPLPCWAVFTEGHITFDGYLSACCFDHDGRFHMADLNTTPFRDAWNSEKFQTLRAAHLTLDVRNTPCEQCVAWL